MFRFWSKRICDGFQRFDRVFIISLRRSEERRRHMARQMEAFRVNNYVFVDAVDGRLLDLDGMKRSGELVLNSWTGHFLTPGEVGCLLSHIAVWRIIVEEGLATALILEDDAHFRRNADAYLAEVLAEAPQDWDIIHFHSHFPVGYGNETDRGRIRVARRIWKGNNEGGGTLAYALANRKGIAQYLLDLARPLQYAADGYTNWPTGDWTRGKWHGYISYPFLCSPRGKSTIGSRPLRES
jgi:glycosyl transferase family 25